MQLINQWIVCAPMSIRQSIEPERQFSKWMVDAQPKQKRKNENLNKKKTLSLCCYSHCIGTIDGCTALTRTEKEKKNPPTHNRSYININVSLIELLYILRQNETSSNVKRENGETHTHASNKTYGSSAWATHTHITQRTIRMSNPHSMPIEAINFN